MTERPDPHAPVATTEEQSALQLAGDPVPDPGLAEHDPRLSDVDPAATRRVERQVSTMFGLSALLTLAVVVAYVAIPTDAFIFNASASNLALGGGLGLALLLIGVGAIQWSKKLMADHEIVEERHSVASSEEDRQAAVSVVAEANVESGFGRRKMIRGSLIGALAALGLPAVVFLGDLGPLATARPMHTVWRRGMRVVNDVNFEPIRAEDIQIGQLINAVPAAIGEMEHHDEILAAKATSAVIVVRMAPDEIHAAENRRDWGIDGVLCYSKICTHVGCPTNLYERHTKHLLCPCHQSTFDLSNNGKVVFGPATRAMPQLPIMVDDEGYLVAQSDFTEPVGPSYWERERDAEYRWGREERNENGA